MKKIIWIGLSVVGTAAALYHFAGVRVSLDGSGMPRFISTLPNYDALEAERARQRELPSFAPAASPESAPQVVEPIADAVAVASQTSQPLTAPPAAAANSNENTKDEWSDFRGPQRDGRVDVEIRTDWPSTGLPELWRHPIGLGYASFVVADGRAFTIEQRRTQEVVAAYDIASGRELWTNGWDGQFMESMGGDGPRATPTVHEGRVYALGAEGELRSLDARTGAMQWRHNILTENGARNLTWGMAAAPLVVDDAVVVLPGGPRGKSVVAYDRITGEVMWSALDDRQAYTSPMMATLAGVRQILIVSSTRAIGLSVDGGQVLWEYPWGNNQGISVAQPLILDNDRVLLSASYGTGAAVFEVRHDGERFMARTVWENQRMKTRFTSPVLHDGYVYGLDESILTCLDAATGEAKWKAGRYGYGQVLLVGDRLIVLTEDGEVVQVRATPTGHEELARFSAIDGKTWNHPIIVSGRLLVRNGREMAAFDITPKGLGTGG